MQRLMIILSSFFVYNLHANAASIDKASAVNTTLKNTSVLNERYSEASFNSEGLIHSTTSPNGQYILYSSQGEIVVYEIKTGKKNTLANIQGNKITSASFSQNGKYILTISNTEDIHQNVVKVWDFSRLNPVYEQIGHIIKTASLNFDGKYLLIYEYNELRYETVAKVYDIAAKKLILEKAGETKLEASESFSSNGKYLLTAQQAGVNSAKIVKVYDLNTQEVLIEEKLNRRDYSNAHKFSSNGQYVIIQHTNNEMTLIDISTKRSIATRVMGNISHDNRTMVTYDNYNLSVIDLSTEKTISSTPYVLRNINKISFSIDGKRILLTTFNSSNESHALANVFDIASQKTVFEISNYNLGNVELSPNGKYLLANIDMSREPYKSIYAEIYEIDTNILFSKIRLMESDVARGLNYFALEAKFTIDGNYVMTALQWSYLLNSKDSSSKVYNGINLYNIQ